MTCRELRLCFEDPLRLDAACRAEAEHLAHCAECACFVETQREIGAGLRLIRESAPQPPGALDAAILGNYRQYVTDRPSPANSTPRRRGFAILCGSATAAAVLLVAALLFFPAKRAVISVARPPAEPAVGSQPLMETIPSSIHATKAKRSHAARRQRSAPPVAAPESPLSASFRSLMYCDELSCGEAMDVIRVQLPASGIGSAPGPVPANGKVFAEVLVGPDGIARGIRILEQTL